MTDDWTLLAQLRFKKGAGPTWNEKPFCSSLARCVSLSSCNCVRRVSAAKNRMKVRTPFFFQRAACSRKSSQAVLISALVAGLMALALSGSKRTIFVINQ